VTIYRHRQVGTVILWTVGITAAVQLTLTLVFAAIVPAVAIALGISLVILLACLVLFGSLTVEVTPEQVRLGFGPGWIRKSFETAEIVEARKVVNPWYYGWGIRLTPHGWLFNVSGNDAVEIRLRNDRRYRIGTDEPHRLLMAIEGVAGAAQARRSP
jgi:hypothetical protein